MLQPANLGHLNVVYELVGITEVTSTDRRVICDL